MIFALDQKPADAPAVRTPDGNTLTYHALIRETEYLRPFFQRGGLVFCLCRNDPGTLTGYLAALEGETVPLLLSAALPEPQLDALWRTYAPSWVWAPLSESERFYAQLGKPVLERQTYGLWRTGFPACPVARELKLLLATSGSTGSPKLVRLSRRNLEANAESIASYLMLNERERPITTLPFQYAYGLSVVNSHLFAGACLLMTTESCVQQGFWDFFHREKATSLSGVPDTYAILRRLRLFEAPPPPALTALTQAGGKLPTTLQLEIGRWAQQYGVKFTVMYGQTEATARMSYLPHGRCLEKPGSIGVAIPGGKLSLVDETGACIDQPDQTGELVYRGENVSLGYAEQRADLLLGDERGGVLDTGDLAKRDGEGYYYIVGRKKRFVKLAGVRVSLDQCEQLLRDTFPATEFACVGRDGCLLICGTDPDQVRQAIRWLPRHLRMNRTLFAGHFLAELPKNEAGKIQYRALQELL